MKVVYTSEIVEKQCTSIKQAKKLLGGDMRLVQSLFSRITALEQATVLKDIINTPSFHFHHLKNKKGKNLEGYFAIDVKSRKDAWRLILQPLNTMYEPFDPCLIHEIAKIVQIVEISEVSKHYE